MDNDRIEAYWRSYLRTLPADSPVHDEQYVAEGWGDSPRVADELGALISDGTKTATCSALWEYEAEGEPLPEIGVKTIVLDGDEDPLCIIETTEVDVVRYDAVDAQFAYEEGEGDRSLDFWRDAHWRYFSRTLPEIGREPTMDMPLVCERFRVIYRKVAGAVRVQHDEPTEFSFGLRRRSGAESPQPLRGADRRRSDRRSRGSLGGPGSDLH